MNAQSGDVDTNGDIVDKLLEVARTVGRPPLRMEALRSSFASESPIDLDAHLVAIVRLIGSSVALERPAGL